MTREKLVEQYAYHGYANNGRPIPKRSSLQVPPWHPAVQPASPPRAGHHPGLHDESMPYQTADLPKRNASAYDTPVPTHLRNPSQAPTVEFDDVDGEEYEPPRLPTSSLRYDQLLPGTYTQGTTRMNVYHQAPPAHPTTKHPPQTQRQQERTTGERERRGPHWLVFVGLTMFLMVLGWVALTVVANWYQVTQDDLHYGRPRTFQCDAVVGHHDSSANPSHFIAVNLNRHIEVIEQPGGDPTKAHLYLVLTLLGDGEDLTPVTVSFKDVTGNGKLDMLVHIAGQTMVYLNENGQFRPARPEDHLHL